ncbi:MAG TPA: DUF4340 domain-containing protein [Candidatus Didemnitutus sp.]|nr:DUF4340 domain-containing protein [Candidatus Didemnitutus sp.]
MRLKTLALSVLVLAILAGLAWYLGRPAAPLSADARIGQPVIDRAVIEKATHLAISDQGKSVQLARQPDGSWKVASYFDLPADFSKLTSFIGSLTEAKFQRLVTSNPARVDRLEFKDTAIALADDGNHTLWKLVLGKTPEVGTGRFVRFEGESKAYLADLNVWLDADSKNWAKTEILDVKADDIASIVVPLPDGPVTLSRAKKDSPWTADKTPAGQKLKADRIPGLLSTLGTQRFTETADPTDANAVAAKAHEHSYTITTFDHRTLTIALGRKPEEKKLKPVAPKKPDEAAAKKPEEPAAKPDESAKKDEPKDAKPPEPEYDITPAGPVYVFISDKDAAAPINALMAKRAFQVADYGFTSLPTKEDDLFEKPPEPPKAEAKPAAPPAAAKP